jgi:hypothetical protein
MNLEDFTLEVPINLGGISVMALAGLTIVLTFGAETIVVTLGGESTILLKVAVTRAGAGTGVTILVTAIGVEVSTFSTFVTVSETTFTGLT